MINTTLDVAEAEAGVNHHTKETIDLCKLTEDACELFEPVAENKAIDLSIKVQAGCTLPGNRQNIQRMLTNLLDNALKYTVEKGKVHVVLSRNTHDVSIAFSDTGIGIPAADQQRVFERFFRGDQSRSKQGCGLGLSFARAVARAHGGDIKLSSKPAQGSTFTIILPATPVFG